MAGSLSLLGRVTSDFTIMSQVFDRVVHERLVLLQKPVYFHVGFETEQLADVGLRKPVIPVSIERDGLHNGAGPFLAAADQLG